MYYYSKYYYSKVLLIILAEKYKMAEKFAESKNM